MTEDLIKRIEKEISAISFPNALPELYDPIRYTLSLGGKRLRPLLLLMAAELFEEGSANALNQALGIEIFHNFTLIHDDVMDNAPLRRGKPTVFRKWNKNTAILSGDVMFALATRHILLNAGTHLQAVMEVFLKTAVEVCEGQQMDINFETRATVGMPEYMKMVQLKTARLIAGGMKIGAIVGGGNPDDIKAIEAYGLRIGQAFQLMDDYLDIFGETEKFGKLKGGDILAGKKTYFYIKTHEVADEQDRRAIEQLYLSVDNEKLQKIEKATALFQKYGVDNLLKLEVMKLLSEGEEFLLAVSGNQKTKMELINLTRQLTKRET